MAPATQLPRRQRRTPAAHLKRLVVRFHRHLPPACDVTHRVRICTFVPVKHVTLEATRCALPYAPSACLRHDSLCVCVCVCVCVYVYVCVCVCVCVCIYVYTYVFILCMYLFIYVCIQVCIHVRIYIWLKINLDTRKHLFY